MLNKRIKEGIKKYHNPNKRIRFCLGTLALVCLCFILLIVSTFTQIKINFQLPDDGIHNYLKFEYIPQIPVVIFIAGLLGEYWGLFTVVLYILTGLSGLFPVFALGGGLGYIFQYNFGYIFAYIFGLIFVSKELNKSTGLAHIILAVLYGVLTIHLIGTFYMIIISLIRHESLDFMANWIYFQSLSKILYDIVFGIIALITAKGLRKILWLILG